MMRPVGIEPTTSGSGGHVTSHDSGRRPTTIAVNHAGFLSLPPRKPAWLREPVLGRLGHEWGTRNRADAVAEEPSVRFDFEMPDELQAGAYANLLNVWHTPYEFTLDFSVIQPAQPPEEGEAPDVPARVVARVRIPPSILFEVPC
jgi:hypothetical protein